LRATTITVGPKHPPEEPLLVEGPGEAAFEKADPPKVESKVCKLLAPETDAPESFVGIAGGCKSVES
jgi:hypothetical protein